MSENDVIRMLEYLIVNPLSVLSVFDNGFSTVFGNIELECLGACVKVTLENNIVISIDLISERQRINDLINEVKNASKEHELNRIFSIINGKDRW